jgi:methyl-accepting chemotaxis protein
MSDQYERQERNITSLKFRITLFFLFFFIAIFTVFVVTSVVEVNTVVRFVGSRLAAATVERVSRLIDGDAFESLSKSLDRNDPYYEKTRLQMLDIKEQSGCVYLYTMTPKTKTVYRYIIDGSAPPEDSENFSPLGAEEDISLWESAFMEAVETGTIKLGSIDQSEIWGQLISAYGPIFNSRGSIVGVIGCDLEADPIIEWIRSRVFWQLGIVLAFLGIGLAVYLSLIKKVGSFYEEK